MKFVHWTDERNVRLISRTGIRMSRRTYYGQGVFCVPIVAGSQAAVRLPHQENEGHVPSNKPLWRYLVAQRSRKKRAAAVIFELKQHRDCEITAICLVRRGFPVWTVLENLLQQGRIAADPHVLAEARFANARRMSYEVTVKACDPAALNPIAACYASELFNDGYCDSFQVVIGRRVRPDEICKIETNRPKPPFRQRGWFEED